MRNLLYASVGFLIVLLIVAAAVLYALVLRPLPRTEGVIALAGLSAPVRVLRDRWGVPHLYAQTEHDLLIAQGFVQAQDRMWQMETNRRLAAGRLSEIVGEKAIDVDRFARTVGFLRAAKAEVAAADTQSRVMLDAFATGVNAYLSLHRGNLPLEFRVLGVEPEPWQPADSLAWGKFMAFMGGKNWQEEIVRAMLVHRLGAERASALLERIESPLSAASVEGDGLQKAVSSLLRGWPGISGGASNNWAVHGSRTETGAPLMANDMHLPLHVPSIWYEMQLSGGALDVVGLSLAGTPLIAAGHNRHLAWGITFAYIDNQDLFVERLDPGVEGRYLYRGQWLPVEIVEEPIRVKGRAEPVNHRVWVTKHGPLLNLPGEPMTGKRQALALKWTAHEPGDMIGHLYRLNRAANVAESRAIAAEWTEPAVNLVFADTEGDIGYALGARVPIRSTGHGIGPFTGWTGENEWKGAVPAGQMPSYANPAEGFVVTANDRIRIPGFQRYLSADFAPGYRAERIAQVLSTGGPASVESFRQLQGDLLCLPAQQFVSAIEGFSAKDPEAETLLALLRAWDREMSPESVGAAVYSVLYYRLLENTFRDDLGELTEPFFGVGLTALQPLNRFSGHSRVILLSLMTEPGSKWFDDTRTDQRETLGMILEKSLEETTAFLKHRLGPAPEGWQWGRLHTVQIEHPLGRIWPLDRLLNIGPFTGGGHFCTVAQSSVMPGMDFTLNGWAVSNRHIYDLNDWDNSLGSIVPGQSGMAGSPHYKDQVELWRKVAHHPLYFSREKVETEAVHVLELVPGKE
ncbi:MAG: penicillin acylase family protein [Desulfobacterales bacterium]|jgi:penicillin amidase